MYDSAFRPTGATVAVDNSAVQQVKSNLDLSTNWQQYRIRNTGAAGYIGWSTPNIASGTPAIVTTAPVVGTPQVILGMLPTSVEVFTLPANAWFQASAGATFEVTPGEGY